VLWLAPTIYYVVAVGGLGVTSKLALRTLAWQDVILWSGVGYILVASFLLIVGQAGVHASTNTWWAALSAALAISSLISLYLALGHGDATKVAAISAAYPAVTALIAAAALGEALTMARIAGIVLVVGGVIILTVAK
jgi:small multidrug resistance pump